MNHDDLDRVADLLGLVYLPDLAHPPTAARVSEALKDLARLQHELRALAQRCRSDAYQPAASDRHE